MEDIRVDEHGRFHCWKCGGTNLLSKRTFRSKAMVGVGALATHKKLKCQSCGQYNQTGNAMRFSQEGIGKTRFQIEASAQKARRVASKQGLEQVRQREMEALALIEQAMTLVEVAKSRGDAPDTVSEESTRCTDILRNQIPPFGSALKELGMAAASRGDRNTASEAMAACQRIVEQLNRVTAAASLTP